MTRSFDIDGNLYFREKGLQRKTAPNVSMVPQSDILTAIRAFLRSYPLEIPSRTNQNLVLRSPGESSGTVVLPLWIQSATFNPISPHWSAFITLLDALRPLLEVVGRIFKSIRPYDYTHAENIFLSEIWMSDPPVHRIPGRRPSSADCFSSLRISANLALTPGPCNSENTVNFGIYGGSKAEWALMTFVGEGKPRLEFPSLVMGEREGPRDEMGLRVGAEDLLVLEPGLEVGSKPFVGESYQLEFFAPSRQGDI